MTTRKSALPAPAHGARPASLRRRRSVTPCLRMTVPASKERAVMREFGLNTSALSEHEAQQQRDRLTALIQHGRARGFLTAQEIRDHLPDRLVDTSGLLGNL
jgi:hypothetical protein